MNSEAFLRILGGSVLGLVLFCSGLATAQEDEAIGFILLTRGSVTAEAADGSSRNLGRRSEIFTQDTIQTGPAGFAQIRLVDNAIIALKENTVFRFDDYSYDGEAGNADRAIMNLVQGGFRTIDGLISDSDENEYRVDTQYASIGVRGTTHEAVIDQALDALFTGVWDGGTTVFNDQDPDGVNLGVGGNFDFSRTDAGQAPQGLNQIPAQLGNIVIQQNPNLANDDDGAGDDDDGNNLVAQNDDGDDEDQEAIDELSEEIANNASLGSNANVNANAGNAPGNTVAVAATTGNPSNTNNSAPDTQGNSSTNVQVQINPANNARSINALAGNNNAGGNGNGNGNSGNNGNGNSNAGGNSGNSGGGNSNAGGNSGNSGNGNSNAGGNSGNSGNSGGGNSNAGGNSGNSGGGDTTGGNGNSGNSGGGNSGNSGGGNSGNSGGGNSGNSGGGNSGNSGGGDTTGGNSGNGNSGNGGGGNSGNTGGGNSGGGNSGNTGGGNSGTGGGGNSGNTGGGNSGTGGGGDTTGGNGGGNSGNTGGGNSGNSGGGNSGGGNSTTNLVPSNPDLNAQQCEREPSCSLVDPNLVPSNPDLTVQQCLVDPSCSLVERTSNSLRQSGDSVVVNLITSVSNLVIESVGQVGVTDIDGATVLFTSVPANAEGGVVSSASIGDLTVDWGYWSLPGLLESSFELNGADFQRVYLAVVDPANMDDLKSVSGNWSYNSVANQFTGAGSAGTLTGLDVGFDVDLNSGVISNGSFNADVGYGAQTWSIGFTGSVNGATATMGNFTDAVVISPAGMTRGIDGSMGGVFTGAGDTSGFVTGFSLENSAGAALGGMGLLEGAPK